MSEKTYCVLEDGCDRSAAECKQRCAAATLEPSNFPSQHPDERMRKSIKDMDPCHPKSWKDGEKKMIPLSTAGKH